MVQLCPVCRITLDKDNLAVAGASGPPPYAVPVDYRGPLNDPPTYSNQNEDESVDPEMTNVVINNSNENVQQEEEAVPQYEQNQSVMQLPDIGELKTTEDGIYVIHYVSPRDTLVGISFKYNVPVDHIKRANKMFSSNINEREKLIIPGAKTLPKTVNDPTDEMKVERERQRLTKRFQVATKSPEEETKFYLEEHDYDVEKALQSYKDDVEWEKLHQPPSNFGATPKSSTFSSASASSTSSFFSSASKPAASTGFFSISFDPFFKKGKNSRRSIFEELSPFSLGDSMASSVIPLVPMGFSATHTSRLF